MPNDISLPVLRRLVFAATEIALELHETMDGYCLKVVSDRGDMLLKTKRGNIRFFKDLETAKRFVIRELHINRLQLQLLPEAA